MKPIVEWILISFSIIEHNFYLAKINVQYLMLQDFYGRPNVVPVEEYWAADPSNYVQPSEYYCIFFVTFNMYNIYFQDHIAESDADAFILGPCQARLRTKSLQSQWVAT